MIYEILEKIRYQLEQGEVNLMQLSRRSGIAYGTLHALSKGEGNPTLSTLQSIQKHLFDANDNPDLTCENCVHCINFDRKIKTVGCEIALASKDDLMACWLYKE